MEKISSLQVLRFFAAALVLFSHIEGRVIDFGQRFDVSVQTIGFSGRFGVDIFFVISGFIMGWLSLQSFGQPGMSRKFILDRFTRIVPLYWVCTLVSACLALLAATMGDPERANVPTVDHLVRSLLFIPYLDDRGIHRPVLGQGWTLDFEMMFYYVFALCLLLKRPWGLITLACSFVAIYALSTFDPLPMALRIWADPIIFEFLCGAALALVRERIGVTLPIKASTSILVCVIGLMTMLNRSSRWQLLINGVVATSLVALCVLGPNVKPGLIGKTLARFGDWSYSLYLTHGFVLLLVGMAWRKLFGAGHLWAYALIIVVGSIALSYLSFVWVECPFTALLRSKHRASSLSENPALPHAPTSSL